MAMKKLVCIASIAAQHLVVARVIGSHDRRADDVFVPVGVAVGTAPQVQTQQYAPFTLDDTTPVATLNYGGESAGYPFFEVSSLTEPLQVEVKYTEEFGGLNQPFSDGPFAYSNQLGNTFRVETFNITTTGRLVAPLLQGGQKWQSLQLLTPGSVSFSQVGFEATIDTVQPEDLPGQFSSDDEILNEIWKLGARSATAACFDKGSQKAIWEVDAEKGVLARNSRPSLTAEATAWGNYTLEFDTLIQKGGSWWSVAAPIKGNGYTMLLTGELPEATRFANTNTSLTPPNTISLAFGVDFVNQTTLTTWVLDVFEVPFAVQENTWYHITTSLSPSGYLAVFINDTQIFNISRAAYPLATGAFSGSFGFGAYQDQAAYFKNAEVHDTANGTSLYSNALTSQAALVEYGTAEVAASVCLDGPKRDRLVWLGDFYHTARILAASTSRVDHSRGTLQFLLDSQLANGQLNISPNLGYDVKATAEAMAAPAGSFGLPDYQILGLISFGDHVRLHGDVEWARETWEGWQKTIDWLLGKINGTTELVTLPSPYAFIGGPDAGSPVSCATVQALKGVADVAAAINDTESEERYRAAASSLNDAVNAKLWNEDIGAYSYSIYNLTDISVPGTAFCITSGVASPDQTTRSISALSSLRLGPGYKDSSAISSTDPTVNISPNTNGFLLPALFQGNATAEAGKLLRELWGAMLASNETNVGASWEYVNSATLAPGLGLFTSLSHPWGGAPTYVLTEWAAGLRPAAGVEGFGYKSWVLAPETGAQLGLKQASARVVTPFGDLSVEWEVEGQNVSATIEAPAETSGSFVYGDHVVALSGNTTYQFSVDIST
ncbi:hypothetical protein N8I77_008730 [Diaporthe amygdali]|uniref:Uncharacterized protein n=1 Tax=Phomopsis amygdali TaxID=1214568 RepID=A0AAD9S8Q1_PHOAM|nr:hypothetical protein N8I77_008730 [Diaporthe amygdali]